MATTRFASTLLDILRQVAVRRVPTKYPEDEVYALRYRAYRHENFIDTNPDERTYDGFDEAPNANIFGVYIEEKLVSTIRFHVVTPDQRISASRIVFPDALNRLLDKGIGYIDPSRFAVDVEARQAYPALPFLTLRTVAMACEYYADRTALCVSSVRPEHAPFYRRVFGSKLYTDEVGYYPGTTFPMHLYTADVAEIRDRVAVRFPFFMSTAKEREQLFNSAGGIGIEHLVRATAREAQDDQNELPDRDPRSDNE